MVEIINKNKPKQHYRFGNITLSVWEKEFEGKPISSYTLSKSYTDKEGNWQNTAIFNKQDLFKVSLLIDSILEDEVTKSDTGKLD